MSPRPLAHYEAVLVGLLPNDDRVSEERALVLNPRTIHTIAALDRACGADLGEVTIACIGLLYAAAEHGHSCLDLDDLNAIARGGLPEILKELSGDTILNALHGDLRSGDRGAIRLPEAATEEPVVPLILDGRRLYLQRYFLMERAVIEFLFAEESEERFARPEGFDRQLDVAFAPRTNAPEEVAASALQRQSAQSIFDHRLTILAGGPGTGKTTTVAKLLMALLRSTPEGGSAPKIVLAAPTGKAAQRMRESIDAAIAGVSDEERAAFDAIPSSTLHRLLGLHGNSVHRRRYDAIDADLVIIDETSMVSLWLLVELFRSIGPRTRVLLVGDPDQLQSIDVGSVLGDLVPREGELPQRPNAGFTVHSLQTSMRLVGGASGDELRTLFTSLREGDVDGVIAQLEAPTQAITWIRVEKDQVSATGVAHDGATAAIEEFFEHAATLRRVAATADNAAIIAAMRSSMVLTAVHRGPLSRTWWTTLITKKLGITVPPAPTVPGMPVMVLRNDQGNELWNGDAGLVVSSANGPVVKIPTGPSSTRSVSPTAFADWQPWWAMTIHKSQGSEFDHVLVSLPVEVNPLLTRQLIYTAATRTKQRLTIVATEQSLRAALSEKASRASGLRAQLWDSSGALTNS